MRRRALLGLLGAAASAGCASIGDPATEPTPTPAPVPAISATATPESPTGSEGDPDQPDNWWSVVEFETTAVTAALTNARYRMPDGGEVTLQFGRTATDQHPATVRGVFRNANPFANTFRLDALALFQPVPTAWPGGRPHDPDYTFHDELVLAPTDRHDIALSVPELTLAGDDRWRLASEVNGPWLPETKALEPEETFRFEYAVAGRPEGRGSRATRIASRATANGRSASTSGQLLHRDPATSRSSATPRYPRCPTPNACPGSMTPKRRHQCTSDRAPNRPICPRRSISRS